jgi:pimeloyl-ACP methyl ester carboxylesterase
MTENTLPFPTPSHVPTHVSEAMLKENLVSAWPRDVVRTDLSVDNMRFPLVSAGEVRVMRRDVLCVHGLGHDMSDFAPLFARRPARIRLHALDLPGFGTADLTGARVDLDVLVRAVETALAHIDAPTVIVGSSLGGHVALLVALRARVPLTGLVLAAPGGLSDATRGQADLARAYYSMSAITARSEDEILRNSQRIFVRKDDPDALRIAARKLAIHRSPLRAAYARPFADVVDDVFKHPLSTRIGDLRLPFVIVHGTADVVVEREPLVRAVDENPRGEFVGLSGVAHLPMVEAADAFADIVATRVSMETRT